MDSYLAPAYSQSFELVIKRSRFITTVAPANSKLIATQLIEHCRNKYPDANHHCWAMVAGHPDDVYVRDQSDDGEPKGTAGKPMLNVLSHSGMGNAVVVVTRFFGGVKLGAGGLVRAYTQCVVNALDEVIKETVFVCHSVFCLLPYSSLAILEHALRGTHIEIADKQFSDQLLIELRVPKSEQVWLDEKLAHLGAQLVPDPNQSK